MKRFLLASVTLLAMSAVANANIVQDFGLDPTSATGAFNQSLGTSTSFFDNQFLFHLDHAMTLTIASVTNVFPNPTDFITNFTGEVVRGTPGAIGNTVVIGPVTATAGCGLIVQCQGFAGSAVLNAGNYFLDIQGIAGGTSGYGGNLATFAAVPGPMAGAGLPGLLTAMGALWALGRRRRKRLDDVA